ncbi:hypothetical protein F4818DRAFT_402025 [Hypoxylon cercidicola]|nr:hypothetical protein F4818DRAFT_402025 [Hypoxylon cercidicola]
MPSTGNTTQLSGTKIEPLELEVKYSTSHDDTDRGSAGSNRTVDQTRIDPLGGKGQRQHTAPHADSQGVVGTAENIGKSKIAPLEGAKEAQIPRTGLDDEQVDASRINPLGRVKE